MNDASSATADVSKQFVSCSDKKAFDALGEIIDITSELFGSRVEVTRDADPEYPDERYVRFTVKVSGSVAEILEKEAEWARRIAKVDPKWDAFRLSIQRRK